MHNYHDAHGSLPPAAVRGPDGTPLLSWRVLLLPYLEGDDLYRQFRLDEPWDSDHNRTLLDRMPPNYKPFKDRECPAGHTFYQVVVGRGSPFAGTRKFEDFKDRMADVFLIAEAGESVPWTKPAEAEYEPGAALPALGGIHRDGRFRAVSLDGGVADYDLADVETIRARLTVR